MTVTRRDIGPVRYAGTTVVITGASSGLGAEFARQLAARKADLVLVARREDRLQSLASQLQKAHGTRATVIPLDLARPDAATAVTTELDRRDLTADSLVNSAGFGLAGEFARTDPGQLAHMIAVNVQTLTTLTRQLLPSLQSVGRGILVNIASTAAYQPDPGMAAYGASKAYVLSLTEAIAHESRHTGLRVLALSPGPTRTEFFDAIGTEGAAVGRFQTSSQVVSAALAELDRGDPRPSIVSGRLNALTASMARLVPRRMATAAAARALKR